MTSLPDLIHNRFKVLGSLGEGAMGHVWLVEDLPSGRKVAMKVLATPDGPTPGALLQFKQEFRLMTQLRHPHCCEVYEYGTLVDGRPFFTMEVVEGHGLDELLRQASGGRLESARTRELLIQLLMALDGVHQLGLVHRDLKSANVRVRPDGTLKLMDFGLMEYAGRSDAPIKGTLAYLAPEAIKRGPVDLRADLYAVGCLAYELLVGHPPFQGDRPIDILRAHVEDVAPPPSWHVPGVDAALEAVVMRLLAKDPTDRYQGAFRVLDDLGYQVPARLGGTLLTSPLVGRQTVLDTLVQRLERVARKEPGGVVCVYGGSGIGKSRLLEEFRYQVMLESLPITAGRPYEQGNAPYALLVQVLRGLLPSLQEHVPAELLRAAPALVKLLPELAELAGTPVVPAPELDMAGEKLRLQDAAGSLLTALAERQPFVVAIDDWHWADALSLEVWQALMTQLSGAAIAFLLTSRYAPEGSPAWMSRVTPLPLPLLDAAGVSRMITAMLGDVDVAPSFVQQVVELAEGSPFFVERLLEHLVQTGAIRFLKGVWYTDVVLGPDVVPRTLQPLLIGKVSTLGPLAQHVARLAAVRGREMDLTFLDAVCDAPEDALFAAIDELVASRVFDTLGGGTFRFAQDHFHEFLYADLTADERQRLHALVANALAAPWRERALEAATLELVSDVAHHAIVAEDAALTVPFALEAARRHARLYAPGTAERLLKAGLAQLAALPADPRLRMEFLVALGDARRQLGNMHGAKQAYTEALPVAEALGEELVCGRLLGSLGMVHRMLGSWAEAFQACERALPLLLAGHAYAEAIEARLTTSRAHLFKGDARSALEEAEHALALARENGEPRSVAEALAHFGHMLITFEPQRYQEGMRYLNETLAILPGLGDKSGLRNAYLLLGNAQAQLGDYSAARICFGRSLTLSEEVGYQAGAVGALVNLGLVGLEQGEFAAAVAAARDAYNRALRLQHTYLIGVSLVVEGVALAYRGQTSTGLALLAQVLGLARDLKNAYLEMLALCWLGEVQIFLGDLDAALATTETLGELMARTGNTEHACRRNAQLAEIYVRRRELTKATDAAEAALSAAQATHAEGDLVRALEGRMRVAIALEQWDLASRTGERALGISQRVGAAHRGALLHGLLGEVALARGAQQAEGHFAAMATLGEGMGIDALVGEARFGQAAARPYGEDSPALVARARTLLEQHAATLEPGGRERFLAMTERARALAGNAIDFSLPRTVQRHTGALIERIQNLADV